MSKKASNFQKVAMSLLYRGKEIFKPLNTGRIDEHVSCIREWIANIFFYTGDTIWFGADGGYSFINVLAVDNALAKQSLATLERRLRDRGLNPVIITGHTGWTDNIDWAFAHRDEVCNSLRRKPKVHDPEAPYDGYDEREDTEEKARTVRLEKQRML